ncbi:MAG: hypothetical protein HQK89_09785 [Nitrospirae bacterium]|nr:hypothetical protein [Nitrospirota bacterium]
MNVRKIEKMKERVFKDSDLNLYIPLAEEYKKIDMVDEAVKVLKFCLKKHPTYMSARVALGKIYMERGYLVNAIEEFESVALAIPDNLLAHKKLSGLYLILGDTHNALKSLEHILVLNPRDKEARELIEELSAPPPPHADQTTPVTQALLEHSPGRESAASPSTTSLDDTVPYDASFLVSDPLPMDLDDRQPLSPDEITGEIEEEVEEDITEEIALKDQIYLETLLRSDSVTEIREITYGSDATTLEIELPAKESQYSDTIELDTTYFSDELSGKLATASDAMEQDSIIAGHRHDQSSFEDEDTASWVTNSDVALPAIEDLDFPYVTNPDTMEDEAHSFEALDKRSDKTLDENPQAEEIPSGETAFPADDQPQEMPSDEMQPDEIQPYGPNIEEHREFEDIEVVGDIENIEDTGLSLETPEDDITSFAIEDVALDSAGVPLVSGDDITEMNIDIFDTVGGNVDGENVGIGNVEILPDTVPGTDVTGLLTDDSKFTDDSALIDDMKLTDDSKTQGLKDDTSYTPSMDTERRSWLKQEIEMVDNYVITGQFLAAIRAYNQLLQQYPDNKEIKQRLQEVRTFAKLLDKDEKALIRRLQSLSARLREKADEYINERISGNGTW